jgi:hypothetical protein
VLALLARPWPSWRTRAEDLLLWLAACLATFVGLWPSMWVRPLDTLARMAQFARETGGEPDEVGSFFLGQAWGDPGPLFYPVSLAFRLTPATTFGLLLLVGLGWSMRRLLSPHRSVLISLLGFGLGFVILLTLGQKKFDRYALPVAPVLLLLAGVGWWLLYRRLRPGLAFGPPAFSALAGLGLLASLQLGALSSVYPYAMSYFNPLLGGGPAAARTVMVGNGEGIDQVARYFNARPEVGQLWVASHSFDLLAATCRCDGEPLRERAPSDADYLVLYGRRIQLKRWGPSLEQYLQEREPTERIWINGIEMARIYRGPKLERAGRA